MTICKQTCPACHRTVSLWPADVLLTTCPDNAAFDSMGFRCPRCATQVTTHADGQRIRLLRASGVREVVLDSRHDDDAPPDPNAPAIDEDDLLRFGLELKATPDGSSPHDPGAATSDDHTSRRAGTSHP